MNVYYNEFDPFAAQWLRNLGAAGVIPKGEVDEKDIRQVKEIELQGYDQAHFFAGIGGWSEALRIAQWPEEEQVWTASCPCQPFSKAGRRKGVEDERHLWPTFCRLVAQCRPSTIFGEQVDSPDGRLWLRNLRADLEALGYRVGAADLCAASVGAPHRRQRLYWVADSERSKNRWGSRKNIETSSDSEKETREQRIWIKSRASRSVDGLGNAERLGFSGKLRRGARGKSSVRFSKASPWNNARPLEGRDGKTRLLESGISPLAHGVSNSVGQIRGYGNAIVPEIAAQFVMAYRDTLT